MKKYLLVSTFLCLSSIAFSQTDLLLEYNQTRIQKQKTAMKILGTWAIGNIAVGGILMTQTEGTTKHFHEMNAGWNIVNLAIAGFGLYGASKLDLASMDAYTSIQEQYKLQKILLFNAGLDVGYMAGGAYLIERSKNTEKRPERMKGWGQSLILQGGFLFVFDLVTYFVLKGDNDKLAPILSAIQPTGNGVGVILNFSDSKILEGNSIFTGF